MGASFRPSVVPIPEPQFLDTVTRAFSQGRAFIERERESKRRAEAFEDQQRFADIELRSLEQELEAQQLFQGAAIQRDPSLVTGPQAQQPGLASQVALGTNVLGDLEQAFAQTAQPSFAPARPEAEPTAPPTGPGRPSFLPAAADEDVELEPLEDQPDVFAGPEGAAVQLPEFRVEAQAPERPPAAQVGQPQPEPPSVSSELAEQLAPEGGLRNLAPPRPGLSQVGTVQGEAVFFDPEGQQRQQSQAGQQINQVLNGLAAREEQAGRTAFAESLRARINGIVSQVETGTVNPAELVGDVIAEVRENAQLQQFRDFLANELGEENVPEGLNELPLQVQVQELQQVRQRLNRPARPSQERGQLTEQAIASGVRQLLTDQGIDPNTATTEQINTARTQFTRFARGADPGQPDPGQQAQQEQNRRAAVTRQIDRILQNLGQIEENDEVIEFRQKLEKVRGEVESLSGDDLIDASRFLIDRENEVNRALVAPSEPTTRQPVGGGRTGGVR